MVLVDSALPLVFTLLTLFCSDQPSAFRSLVRSLTPKKRPKPILVKAGFQQKGNAEDDRDLRVTFNISNGGRSISTSQLPGTTPSCFQDCCNHPILPVAGTLSLIGGISFGYDIGIISGVLQPLREQFNLTCLQEQVMVGCLIGGALLVSLCGGKIGFLSVASVPKIAHRKKCRKVWK